MNYFRGTMSNRKKDIFLLSIAMPIYVTILLNGNVFIQRQLHPKIKVFCFEQVKINFALFELFFVFHDILHTNSRMCRGLSRRDLQKFTTFKWYLVYVQKCHAKERRVQL